MFKLRRQIKYLFIVISLLFAPAVFSATPGSGAPLFVNMTSDDSHRSAMAISFAMDQMKLGHSVTIYINSQGVYVADKKSEGKYAEQQKMLVELIKEGAKVIICPHCIMYYKINKGDLIPGVIIGDPETTGGQLFAPGTVTLSW